MLLLLSKQVVLASFGWIIMIVCLCVFAVPNLYFGFVHYGVTGRVDVITWQTGTITDPQSPQIATKY